ncbi:hypothetical protein Tco_1540387 [Tanacetum coccineum]
MYEAMMTLSDPQKKCLKDMGFERMIHSPIVKLPSALAYHAIDHFHPGSMELRLEKGSIKATRQKVHDMLGIPIGSRKLENLEQRPSNDPFNKEWEEQFKHAPKPTPVAIASVISDTTEADFMFQMNFITLFGSTMGTLDNGGRVSTKLLKRITEDVDISNIDWCERALRSWNTTTMKKRIKMETEAICLGKMEHHGEFDPEEEQDGMNVYKGLDVYVPPINDKEPETKENVEKWSEKFKDDQMMIEFCKQYGELFNDDEFKNLYDSSNEDDSEGEPDGDDENNNHDDDGAPTADAKKQNKVTIKRESKTKKRLINKQKKVEVKQQKKVEVKEQKKVEVKEQKKVEVKEQKKVEEIERRKT